MSIQFTVADLRNEIDRRAEEQQCSLRRDFVARCIAEGVHSDERLRQFIMAAFGVRVPNTQVCETHQTPFRAFADAFFARSPVSVWKASRGLGGKSYLLALLGMCEAILLHADVNILGGSGKQSQNVLSHMGDFWYSPFAPREQLLGDVTREMRFARGNTVEALLASQTSVRGPHPSRLRLDECDEMTLPILDAAMGQPMSKNGVMSQVVQSSTHQYADGTMTQCILRAAEKGYPVFEWCYKETMQPHGWADLVDIERKRDQMSAASWLNEVELQEPSPESRAIVLGAVQATFRPELGVFDGLPRQYIEIESPVQGARYATGADWAKDVDWTVIVTFRTDVDPMRLVAFERTGREPYPVMIEKMNVRVQNFPGNRAHDATGLGNVVSDYIEQGADNIKMVGRRRADLFSEYIAAIERGEIIAPMIKFMETQHRLCSVDDLYGSGHPPDSLVAGAMAYKAAGRRHDAELVKAQNKPVNSRWVTRSSVVRETSSGGRWRNVGSR